LVTDTAPAAASSQGGLIAARADHDAAAAPSLRWWRLAHGALIVLGWVLFFWSWQRVTVNRPEVGELRVLVLLALVVVPVLTLSWVMHNLSIHRRKGARRAVTPVTWSYERDFNGRQPLADWTALTQARRIDIVVDGDTKRFTDAGAPAWTDPP
jgi:hypothetical protein